MLLGELAELAVKNKVTLRRITPSDTNTLASLRRFGLNLEIEGEFHEVMAFLAAIEERRETIWTENVNLEPSRQDGATVQGAVSLVVFDDIRGNSG